MTRLHVLGSGSAGNAFTVEHDDRLLLLDAGFSAREIERRLETAGLAGRRVAGIALTHEHGDHAKGAIRLARRWAAPVLCSTGTWQALGAPADVRHQRVSYGCPVAVDGFVIDGAATAHDAAEPLALRITAPAGARIGVAYDLGRPTVAVRHLLKLCDAIVLEANHDEYLLRVSDYPPVVRQRISGSGGHLSNRAAAELLCEVSHAGLTLVVLAHLSRRCNAEDTALATVREALGKLGWSGELCAAAQEGPARSFPIGSAPALPGAASLRGSAVTPAPGEPSLQLAVE